MVFASLAKPKSDKIHSQQGQELWACEMSCDLGRAPGSKTHPLSLPGLGLSPSPERTRGTWAPSVCPTWPPQPGGKGAPGSGQGRSFVDTGTQRMSSAAIPERNWVHWGFWVDYHPDFQPCMGWNVLCPSAGLAGRQKLTGICISAVGFKNKTREG